MEVGIEEEVKEPPEKHHVLPEDISLGFTWGIGKHSIQKRTHPMKTYDVCNLMHKLEDSSTHHHIWAPYPPNQLFHRRRIRDENFLDTFLYNDYEYADQDLEGLRGIGVIEWCQKPGCHAITLVRWTAEPWEIQLMSHEDRCRKAKLDRLVMDFSQEEEVDIEASVKKEVSTDVSADVAGYTEASAEEDGCTEASAEEDRCTEACADEGGFTEASDNKNDAQTPVHYETVSTEASEVVSSTEPCAGQLTTGRRRCRGGKERRRQRLLAFQLQLTEDRGLPLSRLLIQDTEARSSMIRRQEEAYLSASPCLRRREGGVVRKEMKQEVREEVVQW